MNSSGKTGRTLLAGLLILARTAAAADPPETSFWVWDRHAPLTEAEFIALSAENVRTLYWEMGELESAGGHWHWRWRDAATSAPPGIRIVPVLRLIPRPPAAFDEASIREIVAAVKSPLWLGGALQVDCDTPDRLLPQYAALLRALHAVYPRLEATALAGWSRLPAWKDLQGSVDELLPMFYDLEADPPLAHGAPLPLLDEAAVKSELSSWSACGLPWRAGLPDFARVTLYDARGKSRGHLRAWDWDDLCFNPALAALGPTRLGTTLFRVTENGRIGDTPIFAGETVAARWPDRAALQAAAGAAAAAGARGIVYFSLPDNATAMQGWSLSQIMNPGGESHLLLRQAGPQRLELVNDGPGDLAPRLSGTGSSEDRGYALELDAPAPIFREAVEGDFWRVTGHTGAGAVPLPLATRLTFWFSHLGAKSSLRSGLLQLAPGATLGQVRYRILNSTGTDAWHSIAPAQ